MIFVRYLSEIRYFESRKPIIPTGFRYCVKLHFRPFRFRFLYGWNCFYGLVRNLILECAWRQSYHSIKRIINPAFLSQHDADMARRFVELLKPGQLVKETNVQDMLTSVLYSTAIHGPRNFSCICIFTKLGRDKVLMTPHICIDFWAKSAKGQIQGRAIICQWGAPSSKNFFFRLEEYSNKLNA